MGIFDSIFGKKPDKQDIKAYNYYLNFDYIPKVLYQWKNGNGTFQSAISFDSLINKNNKWKSLIKETSVTSSSLKENTDIMLYLIKSPSTESMADVAMAIIAVNQKIKKYLYYTMEYSFGDFMICSADEKGNHHNIGIDVKNGEQFGAYVIKQALKELKAPVKVEEPSKSQFQSPPSGKGKEYDSFLQKLNDFAENYYKKRGVIRIEDYVVARLVGKEVVLSITQYPDEEFNDPDCQVQLMIEFMDYPNRVKMADYFFRPYDKHDALKEIRNNLKESDVKDKYYSLSQLRQIQMGGLRLQPIDAGIVFEEDQQNVVLAFAAKSPRVKKYLPNLDLSSNEAITKYFSAICQKTEMGLEFGYSIKMNNHGDIGYMGFIFVHTPTLNEVAINFPHWTLDFCLFEGLEGRGFMRGSLITVLSTLKKEMDVKFVYTVISEDNDRCIKLIENLPFYDTGETLTAPDGSKAKLYCCILKNLSFTKPVEFK